MTHTKFIGITIGPIYRTFAKADKTREIWGASYLISYLCRELIRELKCKHQFSDSKFLLPNPHLINCDRTKNTDKPGVGLYPDRILIAAEKGDFDRVKRAVETVKKDIVNQMFRAINKYWAYDPYAKLLKGKIQLNEIAAKEYLKQYLQVYFLEASPEDIALADKDKNLVGTVKSLNVLLDHAELRSSIAGFDPDPMKVFLRGINHSFLLKDAFHWDIKHFPSLPEISTTELRFIQEITEAYDDKVLKDYYALVKKEEEELKAQEQKIQLEQESDPQSGEINAQDNEDTRLFSRELPSDKAENELLEKLFGLADEFGKEDDKRTYHKYVAIIHADGDRMGSLIGSLKDNEVPSFSKDLIEFAQRANTVLAGERFTKKDLVNWGYGAAPIYIGGDDLVFFAPVASRVDNQFQTVFHLIRSLDSVFNEVFNKVTNEEAVKRGEKPIYEKYTGIDANDRPCMTYGISITYVKHPLKEAYQQSRKLMEDVKNDNYPTRNRIKFKVQKHSGQWFGGVIDKNDQLLFNAFIQLLDAKNTSSLNGKTAEQFINSLSQKLRFYQTVIEERAKKDTPADFKIAMEALFENALDEGVHKENEQYLHSIRDLIIAMLNHVKTERSKLLAERQKNGETLSENKAKEDESKYHKQITEAIDTLHGMLRFIHFIRDNEFRN